MTRYDFFLMCVQTTVLKKPISDTAAVSILGEAARVPEEALGTYDPAKAGFEFATWKLLGGGAKGKPEWLEAYDEGQRNRVIVRINPSSEAGNWWMNAEQAFDDSLQGHGMKFPKECAELVAGRATGIEVSRPVADTFRAWVEAIPGHEQQPFVYEDP
jgi:hypothetical protein